MERNAEQKDKWADWLTRRRDADSDTIRDMSKSTFEGIRDRVLDDAEVQPGHVVLDVGTGTGLVAFGAIDRVGEEGRVIFSDISTDCLDQCRGMVEEMGLGAQCEFIVSRAEDLSAIADESVDVVTTRSVVIYVEEKQRAFTEFHRVLKPGGKLSMFEPINSFGYEKKYDLFRGYDPGPVKEIAGKLANGMEERQEKGIETMLDFNERDLIEFAQRAGFSQVQLKMEAFAGLARDFNWEHFYRSAPNPLAPTLEEAAAQILAPEETEAFVAHFKPLVESGYKQVRRAVAFVTARK